MALLQPKNDAKMPKMNVPTIDPKLLIDPSHDNSSFVNSPSIRGVFSDKSTSKAGESHPEILPWPTSTKFAKIKRKKLLDLNKYLFDMKKGC